MEYPANGDCRRDVGPANVQQFSQRLEKDPEAVEAPKSNKCVKEQIDNKTFFVFFLAQFFRKGILRVFQMVRPISAPSLIASIAFLA